MLATGLCLAAFWATIPLPRIDNQLVGSDGVYYYVYLPSFWLDGDLDLRDEYASLLSPAPQSTSIPEQPVGNKYSIGTALLWSPFFLLAHVVVEALDAVGATIPADGYGYVYQAITLSSSILYGGAAMWLSYKLAERASSGRAALMAVILVVFGGSLVYYMTAEPSMSHTVSAFLSSLFFWIWYNKREKASIKTAAIYGALGGLMALARRQDGLFITLPFIARLSDVYASCRTRGDRRLMYVLIRDCAIAALVALIVFFPQMLVWKHFYGGLLSSGYTSSGEGFNWLSPKLGAVLVSSARGLLVWHPVFILALLGLWIGRRRDRPTHSDRCPGFYHPMVPDRKLA